MTLKRQVPVSSRGLPIEGENSGPVQHSCVLDQSARVDPPFSIFTFFLCHLYYEPGKFDMLACFYLDRIFHPKLHDLVLHEM